MTLTKKKMISEIGRRTRLKNRDVQVMLETLVEVWTEELVKGGRIELENFFTLELRTLDRGSNPGLLRSQFQHQVAPAKIQRILVRWSRVVRRKLKGTIL